MFVVKRLENEKGSTSGSVSESYFWVG